MSNDDAPPEGPAVEPTLPEIVNPLGEKGLQELLAKVPGGTGTIELEATTKNLPDVLGALLALFEKGMYSILERTSLTQEEIPVFTNLIHVASHGIGGDLLDIPEPEVGQRVFYELRARRSLRGVELGASSQAFEHIMTAWLNVLRQVEERKLKESQQMIGLR